MKLSEVDEYREEYADDVFDTTVYEEDEEHQIVLEDVHIHIPELNVNVFGAIYNAYNEETGEYEPDFDMYMFFDDTTNEHVYDESGSSLSVCVNNYLHSVDGSGEIDIDELECEFIHGAYSK